MTNADRARRMSRWYPASWRQAHGDEFVALLEDSIGDRAFWPRRGLDVALRGVTKRIFAFRGLARRPSAYLAALTVAALAATGLLVASIHPSRPRESPLRIDIVRIWPFGGIVDVVGHGPIINFALKVNGSMLPAADGYTSCDEVENCTAEFEWSATAQAGTITLQAIAYLPTGSSIDSSLGVQVSS